MLANKLKFLLIAGASLLLATQAACKWKPDYECRSLDGCQCVSGDDCESLPTPG